MKLRTVDAAFREIKAEDPDSGHDRARAVDSAGLQIFV